jgi:hypothetical protein
VAPSHANKPEKISGNEINSRWTPITEQTKRKASVPGDSKTRATGNCIVRKTLIIVCGTENYRGKEI